MGDAARAVMLTAKESKKFRLHVLVGFGVTTVSVLIWALVAMFHSHFPWFIFSAFLFGMTISFHYFFFEKPQTNMFAVHLTWYVLISTLLVVCNFAITPKTAWFFPVLLAGAIPLSIHWAIDAYKDSPDKRVMAHLAFFLTTNAFCFGLWLYLGGGFPWFIYTFWLSAVPLTVHWNMQYHRSSVVLRTHASLFVQMNTLFFFAWMAAGMGFPWFFFTFVGWGLVLGAHYYINRRRQRLRAAATGTSNIGLTVPTAPPSDLQTHSGLPSVNVSLPNVSVSSIPATTAYTELSHKERMRTGQPSDPRLPEASV